jgi:hypothetical protein
MRVDHFLDPLFHVGHVDRRHFEISVSSFLLASVAKRVCAEGRYLIGVAFDVDLVFGRPAFKANPYCFLVVVDVLDEGHTPIIYGVFGIQVHINSKVVLVCWLRQIEFLSCLEAVWILRLRLK